MHTGLLHFHSFWRYVVIVTLIASAIKAVSGWAGKKEFTATDNRLSLFAFIAAHTQLLAGLMLYFISPLTVNGLSDFGAAMKDSELRFFTVEHTLLMLIAITLITLGRILAKKETLSAAKHKKTALFFIAALLLILISVPWPFSGTARPWI